VLGSDRIRARGGVCQRSTGLARQAGQMKGELWLTLAHSMRQTAQTSRDWYSQSEQSSSEGKGDSLAYSAGEILAPQRAQ